MLRTISSTDRLLMPAFGTTAIRDMLEEMRDISDQMLLKWERYCSCSALFSTISEHYYRFGPSRVIDPADDFTRLALDTIAYCSMSYRLNSFYTVCYRINLSIRSANLHLNRTPNLLLPNLWSTS